MEKDKNYYIGCFIGFIIIIVLGIVIWNWWSNLWDNSNTSSSSYSSTSYSHEPTNLELMSYAQTVLTDNINNIKYSRDENDYKFVQTKLRYKIEGNVTTNNGKEKFYLIIQFTDDTYTEYDVVSLQVGNNKIIK